MTVCFYPLRFCFDANYLTLFWSDQVKRVESEQLVEGVLNSYICDCFCVFYVTLVLVNTFSASSS